MSAGAPRRIRVMCPSSLPPSRLVVARAPDGGEYEVLVPASVRAGQRFTAEVEAGPPGDGWDQERGRRSSSAPKRRSKAAKAWSPELEARLARKVGVSRTRDVPSPEPPPQPLPAARRSKAAKVWSPDLEARLARKVGVSRTRDLPPQEPLPARVRSPPASPRILALSVAPVRRRARSAPPGEFASPASICSNSLAISVVVTPSSDDRTRTTATGRSEEPQELGWRQQRRCGGGISDYTCSHPGAILRWRCDISKRLPLGHRACHSPANVSDIALLGGLFTELFVAGRDPTQLLRRHMMEQFHARQQDMEQFHARQQLAQVAIYWFPRSTETRHALIRCAPLLPPVSILYDTYPCPWVVCG
jgi:hypothetical protein